MFRFALPLSILAASSVCAREQSDPLPKPEQIQSLTIPFEHPRFDHVRFVASSDDWAAIRNALLPAQRDPRPAKWEESGTAIFTLKSGDPYIVKLFQTRDKPAAFAAGETYRKRVYYRGGDPQALHAALTAGFDRAKEKGIELTWIRRRFQQADMLKVQVAKDSGGFYETLVLTDDKNQIIPLVEQLQFTDRAKPRKPGNVSSTMAADILAFREGKKLESFRVRGDQLWFGEGDGFQATFHSNAFYLRLKKLASEAP